MAIVRSVSLVNVGEIAKLHAAVRTLVVMDLVDV